MLKGIVQEIRTHYADPVDADIEQAMNKIAQAYVKTREQHKQAELLSALERQLQETSISQPSHRRPGLSDMERAYLDRPDRAHSHRRRGDSPPDRRRRHGGERRGSGTRHSESRGADTDHHSYDTLDDNDWPYENHDGVWDRGLNHDRQMHHEQHNETCYDTRSQSSWDHYRSNVFEGGTREEMSDGYAQWQDGGCAGW